MYLKNSLRDEPLSLIKNLSLENDNYDKAIEILKSHYLNINFMVEKHIEKIVRFEKPKYNDYNATKKFLNDARASIDDLETLGYELVDNSLGDKVISYLLMEKLSNNFKNRLSIILNTDYPTTKQILENYQNILQSLEKIYPAYKQEDNLNKFKNFDKNKQFEKNKNFDKNFKKQNMSYNSGTLHDKSTTSSLGAFATKGENLTVRPCILCSPSVITEDKQYFHVINKCPTYVGKTKALSRLKALGKCGNCLGTHDIDSPDCPGNKEILKYPCKKCNSRKHFSSLHFDNELKNNHCLLVNSSKTCNSRDVLLPSITVTIKYNNIEIKNVRAQLDLGSQVSFMSSNLKNKLTKRNLLTLPYNLVTFAGNRVQDFEIINCELCFSNNFPLNTEFIVLQDFCIDYTATGVKDYVDMLKNHDYKFMDSYFDNIENDFLGDFDILIGCDRLPYLTPLKSVELPTGAAYEYDSKVILFGSLRTLACKDLYNDFLDKQSEKLNKISNNKNFLNKVENNFDNFENNHNVDSVIDENNYNHISDNHEYNHSIDKNIFKDNSVENMDLVVNHIIQPPQYHFNPIQFAKSQSDIDLHFENLFKIESIGISNSSDEISDSEKEQLLKFINEIEFIDGKYYVNIPFKDNIDQVPSNSKAALACLNKVYADLQQKNLISNYHQSFEDQLKKGILEEVNIDQKDFDKLTFIPYFPVIREGDLVSTKVRYCYNASYTPKNSNLPSLNAASFPGIDLLTNMVTLLLKYRSNLHCCSADIQSAFLQIYIKPEQRNKFCLFYKERSGNIKVLRACAVFFGSSPAPFILNQILKFHFDKYEECDVINALKNSFYVDNLLYSTSDLNKLNEMYEKSVKILSEGNFNLREWSPNNDELQSKMIKDNKASEHPDVQKLLGYVYLPRSDSLELADFKLGSGKVTKRIIAAEIGKCFDSLSLFLPVTITGKIILQETWKKHLSWDEEVPNDIQVAWDKHRKNLESLKGIQIPRMTMDLESNENSVFELHNFTDGSKNCYSFCSYIFTEGQSPNLIFSKSKIAPNNRSIPQTEILAVQLSFLCLGLILDSYPKNCIKIINTHIDAQICLQWILTGCCKTKNKFTKTVLMIF